MVPAPSVQDLEPVDAASTEHSESIYLKQDGKVYLVSGWETLIQWARESRVGAEDLVSEGGVRWENVYERPEIARFFDAVGADSASTKPASDSVERMATETARSVPANLLPFASGSPVPASQRGQHALGGVPTGLPPLPVLRAPEPLGSALAVTEDVQTQAVESSQWRVHPEDESSDELLDADDAELFTEELEPALTEELELISDEPADEPANMGPTVDDAVAIDFAEVAAAEDPSGSFASDVLFQEFENNHEISATVHEEDGAERSPWPWVIAVGLLLLALVAVVLYVFSEPQQSSTTPEARSGLTAEQAATEPPPTTPPPLREPVVTPIPVADPDTPPAPPAPPAPSPAAPAPVVAPAPPPVVPVIVPVPSAVTPSARSNTALVDAGWRKVDAGEMSGATRDFLAVLSANPTDPEASFGYGYVLVEQGRLSEARSYLCRAEQAASPTTVAEVRGVLSQHEMSCE